MKNSKESMLRHFSQWEQSGLNMRMRQYYPRENLSFK